MEVLVGYVEGRSSLIVDRRRRRRRRWWSIVMILKVGYHCTPKQFRAHVIFAGTKPYNGRAASHGLFWDKYSCYRLSQGIIAHDYCLSSLSNKKSVFAFGAFHFFLCASRVQRSGLSGLAQAFFSRGPVDINNRYILYSTLRIKNYMTHNAE